MGKFEFLSIATMNIFKLYDNKQAFEISFSEKVDNDDIYSIEEIIKDSFDMKKTTTLITPIIKKENIINLCNISK